MKHLARVSLRSFLRNLGRYKVLLAALILVSAVLTMLLGTVFGMHASLAEKASRYFAGDISIATYGQRSHLTIAEPQAIYDAFDKLSRDPQLGIKATSVRSVYYSSNSSLFFHGEQLPQRRLVGVEWQREGEVLADFDFRSGGLPAAEDLYGLLISTAAANTLGAQVGDEVLVSGSTVQGQANTVRLVVSGIFHEASFFGYTSYLHRETLNSLLNIATDSVHEVGLYLKKTANAAVISQKLYALLSESFEHVAIAQDRDHRDELIAEARQIGNAQLYTIIPLNAQLAEIQDLLDAVSLIAVVIILMFLGITLIGVSNTYALIVYERTVEIGTLRAIGLQKAEAVLLFLLEALCMAFVSVLSGILVGIASLELIRQLIDFSGEGWAALFLTQGRLAWTLPFWAVSATVAVILAAVLAGTFQSAVKAAKVSPVEALRQE